MYDCNFSSASSTFLLCVRCRVLLTTSSPSLFIRFFSATTKRSAHHLGNHPAATAPSTFNRISTLVFTLLTFCPPAPPDLANEIVTSSLVTGLGGVVSVPLGGSGNSSRTRGPPTPRSASLCDDASRFPPSSSNSSSSSSAHGFSSSSKSSSYKSSSHRPARAVVVDARLVAVTDARDDARARVTVTVAGDHDASPTARARELDRCARTGLEVDGDADVPLAARASARAHARASVALVIPVVVVVPDGRARARCANARVAARANIELN
jgi:hypothetical protein